MGTRRLAVPNPIDRSVFSWINYHPKVSFRNGTWTCHAVVSTKAEQIPCHPESQWGEGSRAAPTNRKPSRDPAMDRSLRNDTGSDGSWPTEATGEGGFLVDMPP